MKPKTVPITKRQLAMTELPSIMSQLPRQAGKIDLTNWQGDCSLCGNLIPDGLMTGTVLTPIDTVTVIDAVGICKKCRVLIPYTARFRHNGYVEFMRDGKWVQTRFGGPTLQERIWEKLCLFAGVVSKFWRRP